MSVETLTLKLADRRTLGYSRFGDSSGARCFIFTAV